MYLVGDDERMIVKLAHLYREGVMPEDGGPLRQSARLMAAIDIVTGAWAQLEAARRRKD